MTNQLLTETQAADILGLKPATLRRWRWEGNTVLPWIKLGGAIVNAGVKIHHSPEQKYTTVAA